jgi:hypothetical protein
MGVVSDEYYSTFFYKLSNGEVITLNAPCLEGFRFVLHKLLECFCKVTA